ncbi:hypothetical protein PENTCL1PPCAC_20401, partial [Pristionchus entomophagus]
FLEESDKPGPSIVRKRGRPFGGNGRKTKKEQMRVAKEKGTYRCDFRDCGKICGDQRLLDQHKRIHYKDEMHHCPYCPYYFYFEERLERHVKNLHADGKKVTYPTPKKIVMKKKGPTKDRPYACEHCGYAFKKVADLNKHVPTHTGIRPFNCNLCPTTHIDLAMLKQHQQRTHFVKNHECPTCLEKFMYREEMLTHREGTHGYLRVNKIKALRKQGHLQYRWDKVNKCPFPIKKE